MNPNYGKYIKCFITILLLVFPVSIHAQIPPIRAAAKTVPKIGRGVVVGTSPVIITHSTIVAGKIIGSTQALIVAGSRSGMTPPVVSDFGGHPLPRVDIHPVPTVPTNPPIIPPAYEIAPNPTLPPINETNVDNRPQQNSSKVNNRDIDVPIEQWWEDYLNKIIKEQINNLDIRFAEETLIIFIYKYSPYEYKPAA